MRLPTLLAALVLTSAFLAGCTSDAPEAPPARPAPRDGSSPPPADVRPHPAPVQESGDIAGPFQKTWNLEVPEAGFREATVTFALTGAQAGAPPTARVQFSLIDPEGTVVRTALVGIGAEGDQVAWTLRAPDMPVPGTYVLQAVNGALGEPGAVAAPGFAKYALDAQVHY